jgi:subtilisin family serine protease
MALDMSRRWRTWVWRTFGHQHCRLPRHHTNDIRTEDFMAGRYNFTLPGRPGASIVNLGNITAASGGFAALNLGAIDPSMSAGDVTSGPNSIVGGFVGANAAFNNFPPGQVPGSFPVGTVSSDSAGTGFASGGPGSIVGAQVGQNFPTTGLPAFPTAGTICGNGFCGLLGSGTFGGSNTPAPTRVTLPSQTQLIDDFLKDLTLANFNPGEVVNTQGLNNLPPSPLPGRSGGQPPPFGGRFFVVPPPGAPFVKDEVILQIPNNVPLAQIEAILRRLRLTILDQQTIGLLGLTTYRVHIDNGSPVASVIRAAAAFQLFVGGQANYIYSLAQAPAADADLAGRTQEGDAAQYALGKLGVIDVHRLLRGTNVAIAVIDSEIDVRHPDLDGVIADQYDAVGKDEAPHSHGTGMAGAIAAHRRLMGIAPSARLYAVHAFSNTATSAESTTFSILKGLDWAAGKGVRVINMSFAGPRDPSLERALKSAHDRGIVLIAAAGNAGPKSPPLYPGADPNVIAVTATDVNDKVFSGANRGRYIAVAAPGVDILVPGTDGGYQLTTGTSVACAEVSGVAALLIERNPNLTPEDVRKILTTSAKRLGAKDRDDDYGSGLVDLAKAVQEAGDLKSITPAKR